MNPLKIIFTSILALTHCLGIAQFEVLPLFGESTSGPIVDLECYGQQCYIASLIEFGVWDNNEDSLEYLSSPSDHIDNHQRKIQILGDHTLFMSTATINSSYQLHISYDQGQSWTQIFSNGGIPPDTLRALNYKMFSDKIGFITCTDGRIIETETQFVFMDTTSITGVSENVYDGAYLPGGVRICLTTDGMLREQDSIWVDISPTSNKSYGLLSVYDSTRIFAISGAYPPASFVGSYNTAQLWHSSVITSLNLGKFLGFEHPNDSTILGVGEYLFQPLLFMSRDSGQTWDSIHIPFDMSPTDIEMIDDTIGLVSGAMGELIRFNLNQIELGDTSSLGGIPTYGHTPFDIYPNPNKGVFYLQTNDDVKISNIQILNAAGQLISAKIDWVSGTLHKIDCSMLPSGPYFIRLSTDQGLNHAKIIKIE